MQLFWWRHGLLYCIAISTKRITCQTKTAVSNGTLIPTCVTRLCGGTSYPESCINLPTPCEFHSTAACTIGQFIRCCFGGNGRQRHTIAAALKNEDLQTSSLAISKQLNCAQSAQNDKTNAGLPLPSGNGTGVQIRDRVPATVHSLEEPKETDTRDHVPEDGVERVVDANRSQLGQQPCIDTALVARLCFILEQNGWGPGTEEKLQQFVEKLTSDVVTSVVSQQRNTNLALSFLEWAGRQAGYEHRADTFTKVVGRLGKDRHFAVAWNVLQGMKKSGLDVNYAFSVFIHRLRRACRVGGVVKAMGCMKELDVTPTVPLYTNALTFLLKENRGEEAQKLYLQMLQNGLLPDRTLYEVLISGFGMAGELNKALHFFEEMKTRGFTPDSSNYTSLIRSYAFAGNYEEGQKFYKEMIQNDCWPEVFSEHDLTCILHGKNTMGQIGFFLQDADNNGHILSIYTYNNMLKYLLDAGKLSEAVSLFYMLSGTANDVGGDCLNLSDRGAKLNLSSYTLLIFGLCKAEKVFEALKIFEEMCASEVKPTNAICSILLLSLSNAGLVDEACKFCDHIMELTVSVSVVAQRQFFSAVRTSGNLVKGLEIFETMKRKGCIGTSSDFASLTRNLVLKSTGNS